MELRVSPVTLILQGNIWLPLMRNLCFKFPPPAVFLFNTHGEQPIRQDKFGGSLQTDWKNLPSPVGWGWKGTPGSCLHQWSDLDDIWQTCWKLSVCGLLNIAMRTQEGRRMLRPFLKEMQGKLLQRQNAVPESENEDVDGDLQEL
ncbi:4-hydroxy-3-methylbut-2-en-1-yl diphosphate synthase (flavodoxin) [Frankliniella fusca]|uniref:4-hydroxy-3-methylbut-2-en-1-yl diphosphate synthase (Flavodoxin) n=1 Tax=Frankliniella fusca TaxID=407009 RepID=A0AAE1LMH8_9NEOP|nr:4-hydroxy-3-methylbut-2-en-1-yl diphosphate synthase (flavodoxin) [Frankliniella fusca]